MFWGLLIFEWFRSVVGVGIGVRRVVTVSGEGFHGATESVSLGTEELLIAWLVTVADTLLLTEGSWGQGLGAVLALEAGTTPGECVSRSNAVAGAVEWQSSGDTVVNYCQAENG